MKKLKRMLPKYRNEKFTLTPVKAQRILAQHGTELSLEDAEKMLELLRKLCKLSVNEIFKNTLVPLNPVPVKGKV